MGEFKSTWEIIQLLIGAVLMVSIYFFIIKVVIKKNRLARLKGNDLKYFEIRSVRNKLLKGEKPNKKNLYAFARQIKYRSLLYELLHDFEQLQLFPKEFLSHEKLSESFLANWLDANKDFDQFPNDIKCTSTKQLKVGIKVVVLEFKVNHPYEWSEKGWIFGYVFFKSNSFNPKLISSEFNNEELFEIELQNYLDSIVSKYNLLD